MPQPRVVLLDTSILVDNFKSRTRRKEIETAKKGFDWSITTDIAILEFKAVLIREMAGIHGALRFYKRFTVARDVMLEKKHRQVSL
jgi:hypothetical protein